VRELGTGNREQVGSVRSHRDLIVWQKAMDLATLIYSLSESLPKSELYGLSSQMQRAAVSVAANIAEGNARATTKDYARFVSMARASAVELETLLEIAVRTGRLTAAAVDGARGQTDEVCRMLYVLRSKLEQRVDQE
jgi:four helix bundle protein